MENEIKTNYDYHFNILLEYCKSKYEMPEDKISRLKTKFDKLYDNVLKSIDDIVNNHGLPREKVEKELIEVIEFYFDFDEKYNNSKL